MGNIETLYAFKSILVWQTRKAQVKKIKLEDCPQTDHTEERVSIW